MFDQQLDDLNGSNWYHAQPVWSSPSNTQKAVWVEAAIVVCNAWVVFAGDYHQETWQWTNSVLQQDRPTWKLAPEAILEVMVGYPLHKRQTRANMYEWLQFILQRAGRKQHNYQYQFVPVEVEACGIKVWCLTAVSPLLSNIRQPIEQLSARFYG